MLGKIWVIRVSGVFGILDGIRRFCEESPITIMYSADTVTNEDGSDNINDNLYPIELIVL